MISMPAQQESKECVGGGLYSGKFTRKRAYATWRLMGRGVKQCQMKIKFRRVFGYPGTRNNKESVSMGRLVIHSSHIF